MTHIHIALEHTDFLVIDKPAGVPVQNEPVMQGILPLTCKQQGLDKLWLVHRLDKITSGLLILAKSQTAASRLSSMFARREVNKYYLAIAAKKPKKKQGTVIGDMKKVRGGAWMLQNTMANPAVSQFVTLGLGDGNRLFLVKPLTGKTHQIRVMMKSLGSPIVGDELYKGASADRTYLHAYHLSFYYLNEVFNITHLPDHGTHFCSSAFTQLVTQFTSPASLDWQTIKPALLAVIKSQGADTKYD